MFKYLGINERNSDYIRRLNSKKHHSFAKNKHKTKEFLKSRGISVPVTYQYIQHRWDLQKFDPNTLPKSFVIKPNKGMSGNGILIIKDKKSNNVFETINGNVISKEDILWHCEMIMDGMYDRYGFSDDILVEQFICSDQFINNYQYKGLADIRIIIVNLIPVMAMLRIPYTTTQANISQGAIAVGIDVVKGTYNHFYTTHKISNDLIKDIRDIKIPFWNKILYNSALTQSITNIGYLSVDFAISSNKELYVMEVNSRSGLKIQFANNISLKERLDKVVDISNNNIERGIEISSQLFGSYHFNNKKNPKININISDDLFIVLNNGVKHKVKYKIDLYKKNSCIDRFLAEKLGYKNKAYLKLYIGDKKLDIIADTCDLLENQIVIGSNDLKAFSIII